MKPEITLTARAVRAIASSIVTGPNCVIVPGIEKLINTNKPMTLSEIRKLLDDEFGPAGFLAWYAVEHQTQELDAEDIGKAYCLEHLKMVRASETILQTKSISDNYFKELRERRFDLVKSERPAYFFSCCGKVAVLKSKDKAVVRIGDNQITLEGIVVPEEIKTDLVVFHFATALCDISAAQASQINAIQNRNLWFTYLMDVIGYHVDYRDFCNKNLTQYSKNNLHLD